VTSNVILPEFVEWDLSQFRAKSPYSPGAASLSVVLEKYKNIGVIQQTLPERLSGSVTLNKFVNVINYAGSFELYTVHNVWKHVPDQSASDVAAAAHLVRRLYSEIPDVDAVYQDADEGLTTFWVFTANEQYDDALMDTLISREIEVLDEFPDADLSFKYIPVVFCEKSTDLVSKDATLIFKR
jgi:hypothetical protein